MYATLLPHQKKGGNLTPEKVLPLVWDMQEKAKETPKEQDIEAVKDFWENKDKNKTKT